MKRFRIGIVMAAVWLGCGLPVLIPAPAIAGGGDVCGQGGITCVNDTTDYGADPVVKNAMLTLPDAVAKWRACYRDCMTQPECTARLCSSQCEGQIVAVGQAASRTGEILRYNVMGIYGAECIGNFRQYIQTIQTAAKAAHLGGLSAFNALATVIVDRILDAVMSQILNNLTNQICNVTNQLTTAANSFVQNAICLPNTNLNPFNFNLNIQNLRCDGFSINPLTGQVNGSPINGVNVPIGNVYNSGAVTNPSVMTPSDQITNATSITPDAVTLPNLQLPTIPTGTNPTTTTPTYTTTVDPDGTTHVGPVTIPRIYQVPRTDPTTVPTTGVR